MNQQTAFDAEYAERTKRTQRFPEKDTLTRKVSVDFFFALSATLRSLHPKGVSFGER